MTKGTQNMSRSVSMTIDRSVEEPCEVTSLTHGFEAERRGRPLRLGSALYEWLKRTGLPLECGSGGGTKYNRSTRALPKAHWIDAACVGKSTPAHLQLTGVMPLLISAHGSGHRQMCGTDKHGFPTRHRSRQKRHHGFQTGDMVRAVVPGGKKAGVHVGRVLVRATGSFDIRTTQGRIQGISHRYCTAVSRCDGYSYGQGGRHSSLG